MKKITMKETVDKSLSDGWWMSKQISSAGFMTSATYDRRKIHNREALAKLIGLGFALESDAGTLALNILLRS